MNVTTDSTVDALIRSGDHRAALTELSRAYGARLGRFCAGWSGSPARGEELLQDTLLAALDAMPRYRGAHGVGPWLFGIARRVCAAEHRKETRRRGLFARWFSPAAPVSPHRRSDARMTVSAALGDLKPGLREAVLLRYQQGLDAVEVGAALGISHAAARKRISLGIRALRASLVAAPQRGAATATSTPELAPESPITRPS